MRLHKKLFLKYDIVKYVIRQSFAKSKICALFLFFRNTSYEIHEAKDTKIVILILLC